MIPQQKEDVIPPGAEPAGSGSGGILAARELGKNPFPFKRVAGFANPSVRSRERPTSDRRRSKKTGPRSFGHAVARP
jgi:hypothetical protein